MMLARATICVLGPALLAACSTAPVQEARSPRAERELANELSGRTAGPPQRCIPSYSAKEVQVIDQNTILYRDGRTIYVQNPRGGCTGLGRGATLVTRQLGVAQYCDGDINQTVDLVSGTTRGACVFGPFIPYTRPKG